MHSTDTPFEKEIDNATRYAFYVQSELAALGGRYDSILLKEKEYGTGNYIYNSLMLERQEYTRFYEAILRDIKTTLTGMQHENREWSAKCPGIMCDANIGSEEDFRASIYPYEATDTDVYKCGTQFMHWPSLQCPPTVKRKTTPNESA